METRSIVDSNLNVVGEITMPTGTSEEVWAAKMAPFKITNEEKLARALNLTIKERKAYADDLLERFKKKNLSEGINAAQGIWLQELMAEYKYTYGGRLCQTDICNLAVTGDIELACNALIHGPVDDMSEAYHWLTLERKNWLIADMKNFLRWP